MKYDILTIGFEKVLIGTQQLDMFHQLYDYKTNFN